MTTVCCRRARVASPLLAAVALLASSALLGCSDDGPGNADLPPAVPGDVCSPAEQRCVDAHPEQLEVCRSDGRGWIASQCDPGSSCDPSTNMCMSSLPSCLAGEARCTGSPGTASRQVCSDDGAGWLNESCAGALVCNQSNGACENAVCGPGQSKCDGGPTDPDRSVCADSRLEFIAMPCADGASCVTTSTGAKCVNRVCTPGEAQCSSDHLTVLACDASGTELTPSQPCDANQVCVEGACAPSSTPLGDVVVATSANAGLELGPGRYALAVLDTAIANDLEGEFPVEVGGDVAAAPGSPALPPSPIHDRFCRSLALMRGFHPSASSGEASGEAAPWAPGSTAWPTSDETREFHVPDPETNSAVVFVRTAKLRAVGLHVNLWEDQTVSGPGTLLPDSALDDVMSRLDDAVVPRVQLLSGMPTDVDGNGRIDILFTDLLPNASAAAFVYPLATLFPSGTGSTQVDYGEVVYTQGLNGASQVPELTAVLAHEIQHLIYFGRRLSPYFADPDSIPATIASDVYAVEGLAMVAMAWSGQYYAPPMVSALEAPAEFSLWRLTAPAYLQEPSVNFVSYGYGALVQQYLMQQAGGVAVQGSGSLLVDQGGASYFHAFTSGSSGFSRIRPGDSRPLEQWYADFAAALLVSTLEGKVSAGTAADSRYQLGEAVADPVWGGFLGPSLRYEWTVGATQSGPVLQRIPWSQRPTTLKAGGMSFLGLEVGDAGATLSVSKPSARVVIVRHGA